MADNGPTIEDILAAYGHGETDPVVNTQMPSGLGFSSSANQARGPWIRKAMEQYPHGKELADFFAGLLNYGPAALGSRAGAKAAYETGLPQRLQMRPTGPEGQHEWHPNGPIDPGVVGPKDPGFHGPSAIGLNEGVHSGTSMNDARGGRMGVPGDAWDKMAYRQYLNKTPVGPAENMNAPLQIEPDPYVQAVIDHQWQEMARRSRQPSLTAIEGGPPPAAELAARPGMQSVEDILTPYKGGRHDLPGLDAPDANHRSYGPKILPEMLPGGSSSHQGWASDFRNGAVFKDMTMPELQLNRRFFQDRLQKQGNDRFTVQTLKDIDAAMAAQRGRFDVVPGDKPPE